MRWTQALTERVRQSQSGVSSIPWRERYRELTRAEGKKIDGCGEVKADHERTLMSRYPGRCSVCGGAVPRGEWVHYDTVTKKVRHAPSGWRGIEVIKQQSP